MSSSEKLYNNLALLIALYGELYVESVFQEFLNNDKINTIDKLNELLESKIAY